MFDDFGGRVPSDKPPIKTPGELAIERGEEWPKPVPEPAFKIAIARATEAAEATRAAEARQNGSNGSNGSGANGTPSNGSTQPDYGAPAGWHAPGWPPPPNQQQPQPHPAQYPQQGYWYPPPQQPSGWQPPYAPYQPYPQPGQPNPQGTQANPNEDGGQDKNRPNPPNHG
jgi:cell division protease FtsH